MQASLAFVSIYMLSVADIQTISDIAKNQRKICDNVNYKLPLQYESKKRHSI